LEQGAVFQHRPSDLHQINLSLLITLLSQAAVVVHQATKAQAAVVVLVGLELQQVTKLVILLL
jgi:ribosomal protein S2